MAKPLYSAGEIARAIKDRRDVTPRFWEGRVRTLIVNNLVVPEDWTQGGHLRFEFEQIATAAVFSEMLDLGLSHPKSDKPQGADETAFLAARSALTTYFGKATTNALARALRGVVNGEWWMLRIDHMRDEKTGSMRYLAKAYPIGEDPPFHLPERKGEIPMGSVILNLNPILLPLATDRSGMN